MTNYIIYDSSYKTSTTTNPLRIRNNEIDGIIKIHNGIRYLVFLILVGLIKFVIELNILLVKKNGITDSINHNFARIKIDSY